MQSINSSSSSHFITFLFTTDQESPNIHAEAVAHELLLEAQEHKLASEVVQLTSAVQTVPSSGSDTQFVIGMQFISPVASDDMVEEFAAELVIEMHVLTAGTSESFELANITH